MYTHTHIQYLSLLFSHSHTYTHARPSTHDTVCRAVCHGLLCTEVPGDRDIYSLTHTRTMSILVDNKDSSSMSLPTLARSAFNSIASSPVYSSSLFLPILLATKMRAFWQTTAVDYCNR